MKARARHSLVAAAVGAVLVGPMLSSKAGAAAWEFNPTVEAGYLYDDNYRLNLPGTEISVEGPMVDAQLELLARTQASELSLTPRVRATYFSNEPNLDAVDYFATIDWLHHGQRVLTRVRADVADQDIVNSEQPNASAGGGLGDPDLGDAGRVLVENRRMRASLRPSMSFDLSARREILLGAGYTDVTFDNQFAGAQVDFNATDLSAGLLTRLNERSTLTTSVNGARYEIGNSDPQNSYGAELQWDLSTAAQTRTYLRGGAKNVDLASGDSQVAWIAGAGTAWLAGRNDWFIDLSRNVGPTSAGALVTRDELRVRFTRAMTPRLSLQAGVRGTTDDAVDPASTFEKRKYVTGYVGLQWRWLEEFSVRFAYDYTWQDFRNDTVSAASSGALISFLYQPLQRSR